MSASPSMTSTTASTTPEDLMNLDEDLSRLGETLATRIELEDKLIGALRR